MALESTTLYQRKRKIGNVIEYRWCTSGVAGGSATGSVKSAYKRPRAVSANNTSRGSIRFVYGSSTYTFSQSLSYMQFAADSSGASTTVEFVYGSHPFYKNDIDYGLSNTYDYKVIPSPSGDNAFVGWYARSTKERIQKISDGDDPDNGLFEVESDRRLSIGYKVANADVVAVFGIMFYVYFKANGGTVSPDSPEESAYRQCFYGADNYYIQNAPTNVSVGDPDHKINFIPPKNKVFIGWNTNANGTGTQINVGDDMSKLSSTKNAKVYLYAQWGYKPKATIDDGGVGEISVYSPDGEEIAKSEGGIAEFFYDIGSTYVVRSSYDSVKYAKSSIVVDGERHEIGDGFALTIEGGESVSFAVEYEWNELHSISFDVDNGKGSLAVSPLADHEGKWVSRDIEVRVESKAGYFAKSYSIPEIGIQVEQVPDSGVIRISASEFDTDITISVAFDEAKYIAGARVERGMEVRGTATCSPYGRVGEGEMISFTAAVADESIFEFSGWYRTGDDTPFKIEVEGEMVDAPISFTTSINGEDIVLYARFSIKDGVGGTGTVTLVYADGGDGLGYLGVNDVSNYPGDIAEGQSSIGYTADTGSVVMVSAGVVNGSRFVGWFSNPECTNLVSNMSRLSTFVSDRTLYAKFDDNGHAVMEWEGDSANKTLEWTSKTYRLPVPINPSTVRIDSEGYTVKELSVEMFSAPDTNPTAVATLDNIETQSNRRLPIRRKERFLNVSVKNDSEVDFIVVGTSSIGLSV